MATGLQIRVPTEKLFFLFLKQNICCGYSKEPSQWDGSFEYPKHMLKLIGKEINAILGSQTILIWTYVAIWGGILLSWTGTCGSDLRPKQTSTKGQCDKYYVPFMCRSRKFCQRGSKFDKVFLVDKGIEDPNILQIIRPPAKRLLNGVLLAGRWWPNIECWLDSFVIFQRIRNSIAKKPYIFFLFFRVTPCRRPKPPPPPLDPPMPFLLYWLDQILIITPR